MSGKMCAVTCGPLASGVTPNVADVDDAMELPLATVSVSWLLSTVAIDSRVPASDFLTKIWDAPESARVLILVKVAGTGSLTTARGLRFILATKRDKGGGVRVDQSFLFT